MTQTANQQTMQSPYLPRVGRIVDARKFTDKEAYYRFQFDDGAGIKYSAGQFMEVSLLGVGEVPIRPAPPRASATTWRCASARWAT